MARREHSLRLLNLAYIAAAVAGFVRGRECYGLGLLFLFLLLRARALLGSLENPEPRYTLECYPVIIIAAAALFIGKSNHSN